MGNTLTIIHIGLIAAFTKSPNILNYRLTFLGQLGLNEDRQRHVVVKHNQTSLNPHLTPSLLAVSNQSS